MKDSVGASAAPPSEWATRIAAGPLANSGIAPGTDDDRRRHDLSQIAAQRGVYKDMRADSTSRPTDGPTIVGLRSGTLLDPKLVAELRAVAGRTDIAQRVLTILEPSQAPASPVTADRRGH
jgi:hypothetical protein